VIFKIPITFKIVFAAFLAILIPTYWLAYGPTNFLWFSDIVLFLLFFAVIFEVRFLASMAAIGGLLIESFWTINFFFLLLFDIHLTKLTDYMLDPGIPLGVRLLSLFHLAIPPLAIWLLIRLGYDKRAWLAQTLVAWIVLPVTWLVIKPTRNINWVFEYKTITWVKLNAATYLVLEGIGICLFYALTHGIISLAFAFRKKKSPTFTAASHELSLD
jgi:hypothetical protein